MTTSPVVTVAICSYNHGQWLGAAIESVLSQTYGDLELVVVDDGSTDDSLEIAKSYGARDQRVRVLQHDGGINRGTSATANRTLQEARGRYWAVLGSDDVFEPDKLERQVRELERDPDFAFAYGCTEATDADGRLLPERGLMGADIEERPDPVHFMFRGNHIPAITPLVRMSCLEQPHPLRFAEGMTYSDWDFAIRLVARGRGKFLPVRLARSRIHTYNTSWSTGRDEDLRRRLQVLETIRAEYATLGVRAQRPRTRAALEFEIAALRHEAGDLPAVEDGVHLMLAADPSLATDAPAVREWIGAHCAVDRPTVSPDEHLAAARTVRGTSGGSPVPRPLRERDLSLAVHAACPGELAARLAPWLARLHLALSARSAALAGRTAEARLRAVRYLATGLGRAGDAAGASSMVKILLGDRAVGLARRHGLVAAARRVLAFPTARTARHVGG